jgi:hypothetical protein
MRNLWGGWWRLSEDWRHRMSIKGFLYRLLMRFAHRFDWHYAPVHGPIDPGAEYQRWCKWCGLRQSYRYNPNLRPESVMRLIREEAIRDPL